MNEQATLFGDGEGRSDDPATTSKPGHESAPTSDPCLTSCRTAVPLMADDVCRVCFHEAHAARGCVTVPPADINPYGHPCGCVEYVDAAAEGRIVVHSWSRSEMKSGETWYICPKCGRRK